MGPHKVMLCFLFEFGLLAFFTACHQNISNKHNHTALVCQMSRQDVQGHIVQILDADGQGLSLEQKSRLVAEFYDKKARSSHPSITAGGCIQLPAEEGELAVVDTKSKANVYLSVRAPMEAFQSLRLTKKPNIKFESFCQGENRFAHKQIKRDWNISTDGSLSPIRLLVQARNVHDDQVSFIFQKSFGDELQLPNAWTTELLKEGQYRIEVLVQFLSEGLSLSPQLLGAECPLTILHHAPSILGLSETNTTIQIVDTDKSLDWNSTLEGADLYACLEERSQIPQGSLEEAACQPRVACQLPENFQRVDKIRSKAEGLFNVFVYTKDKADNQSPTQCRTVIFSSQAPQFDLKWAEDRWNHEGAILDTADAVLKAHVSGLSHPEIAAEKLAESLECKVELVLQSIETVSSPRIYCTEGLCRNQTLDVYRPCSPDIGVAIYDFWKASYSNNVTLRLKVRAKDFAGHTREKMRSLIVSNNKWESHIVDGKVPGDAALDKVLKDQNGYILAVYNQSQIRKFSDDGTAIDVTPPGYVDSLSDALIQSADGHIYFVGIKASGNSEILHWVNSQWEHPGLPEISAKSPGKVGVFIHPTGWRRKNRLIILTESRWKNALIFPTAERFCNFQWMIPIEFGLLERIKFFCGWMTAAGKV